MKQFIEGLKVECIDGQFQDTKTNPFLVSDLNLPKERENYIVREVIDTSHGTGILLAEIHNNRYYFDDVKELREPIFSVNRFEIVERQVN